VQADPSKTDQSTLYLVRHGATDANLQRPYVLQGHGIDLSLNPTGQKQAQQVASLLAQRSISAVYASPMRRALETARAIATRCGADVVKREELVECDVGRWEGLSWDGIREQFPQEFENFQRDPSQFPYLGGETYSDVAKRAVPVLEQLLQRHANERFVVVAHNIVNRVCVATFLGLALARAKEIHQANCGVNVIRRENGRTSLVTLNSEFHLQDDGPQ
jgi:broad specificity phosphatase PhoE